MPIYNKSAIEVAAAAAADDHAPQAAKVRRQREQAYFNSYNFDAIEVLPYDEGDDEDDEEEEDEEDAHHVSPPKRHKTPHNAHQLGGRLASHQPMSPNSRRHLKEVVLAARRSAIKDSSTATTSPSSSSRSSRSSSSSSNRRATLKYMHMQRLGAFFGAGGHVRRSKSAAMSQLELGLGLETALEPPLPHEVILGVRDEVTVCAEPNASFLLPRAMLKHQSVGSAANSMPVTVIGAAPSKSSRLPSNSGLKSCSKPTATSTTTTTTTIAIAAAAAAAAAASTNKHHNNNHGSSSSYAQLQMASRGRDQQGAQLLRSSDAANSGFLLKAETSSMAMAMATAEPQARNQPASEAATATTTAGGASNREAARQERQAQPATTTTTTTTKELSKSSSTSSTSSSALSSSSSASSASSTSAPPPLKTGHEARERSSSHQSHYSATDKSAAGSSGYYSSNVCSTYSLLEDHIYCEPVVDILEAGGGGNGKVKLEAHAELLEVEKLATLARKVEQRQQAAAAPSEETPPAAAAAATTPVAGCAAATTTTPPAPPAPAASKPNTTTQPAATAFEEHAQARARAEEDIKLTLRTLHHHQRLQQHTQHHERQHLGVVNFNENLRILETSIENLDRHLRQHPSLSSQEHFATFVHAAHSQQALPPGAPNLPTIMEGYDAAKQPRPFGAEDVADDSLLDIDLDSFLLVNERAAGRGKHGKQAKGGSGIDNPTFLADDLEENHYKCAKYINSCPDHATERGHATTSAAVSESSLTAVESFMKRYEDQLHFQSTRELLEDVREKIRLLARSSGSEAEGEDEQQKQQQQHLNVDRIEVRNEAGEEEMPKELEGMIKMLKSELETYLERMNQQSELEIRQLCSGLVKNQNIVKMKKAFERRRSLTSLQGIEEEIELEIDMDMPPYELISPSMAHSQSYQVRSIRSSSDPNFKMKRKSLNEIFPVAECYVESYTADPSQMQRNLTYHRPILHTGVQQHQHQHHHQQHQQQGTQVGSSKQGASSGSSGIDSNESGDKDAMLEWHRKKPSIWEMYYGTNRMNQTLLGKRTGGVLVTANPATLCYPSSRPESDFTLDLPRAEQLRIKMEKEKKFRQRCRYITTFLSLVFFLLTVMVVSLVLTRGKRMFGSMI